MFVNIGLNHFLTNGKSHITYMFIVEFRVYSLSMKKSSPQANESAYLLISISLVFILRCSDESLQNKANIVQNCH